MAFTKRIEYLIEDLISSNLKDKYPLYSKFLVAFGRYLDNSNYGKILKIENNLDSYTIFSELLNKYLDQYLADAFDPNVFTLTDDNKRQFVDMARLIKGLKGTRQSIALFFQILTNYKVAINGGIVNVEGFGQIFYDESNLPEDILKYYLVMNNFNTGFESLIKNVHPAGTKYYMIGAKHDGTVTRNGTYNHMGLVVNH